MRDRTPTKIELFYLSTDYFDISQVLLIFIICFFLFKGHGPSISLPEKWHPLRYVSEQPLQSKSVITALGNTMYVPNLVEWQNTAEILKNADLMHERVHIYRENKIGAIVFIVKYNLSKKFRLYEEKLAYYAGIRYKIKKGCSINIPEEASRIASSEVYGKIISYEDAKKWVKSVVNGSWVPKKGELPPPVPEPNELLALK